MKFSELTTDNALDVFCEIVPYVDRIINDKELISELKKRVDINENTTNVEKLAIVIARMSTIAPIVFKKRRIDVLGIIAAVNGEDIEVIKKQNIIKTLVQFRDLINDKDFMDFFKSFAVLAEGA